MACLLKAPDGSSKGCVTFTTPEQNLLIAPSPAVRAQIEALKQRYVLGLHHNWHDYKFCYDPLFDFSMAGEGDLVEASGRDFPRIPMDACNFAPRAYSAPRPAPFWDILYVARAVHFKGIPEFFQAIRGLYDSGRSPRVLFVCAMPPTVQTPGPPLREQFESLFTARERKRITFLSLDWDYPFPLDTETLAFFYRNSRIFFHPAPDERRCRTASYAWAGGMAVVANRNVASILPAQFHRPPFLFAFAPPPTPSGLADAGWYGDGPAQMPAALAAALDGADNADESWRDVMAEFSADASATRLCTLLDGFAETWGWGKIAAGPINSGRLDIRLGRHMGISGGTNRVDLSLSDFCEALLTRDDAELRTICRMDDPEESLRQAVEQCTPAPSAAGNVAGKGAQAGKPWPIFAALRKMGLLRS